MFKNMLKRTWLNIVRKPSKSVVLFIIMFIMANLVIAGIAISNSVEESIKYAKESLGSEVYLNVDMEQIKGSMDIDSMDMQSMNMNSIKDMQRPEISASMVIDIAESSYVRDFTYTLETYAVSSEIEIYESTSQMGNRNPMMGMQTGFTITGINSYAFIEGVESNTITISEGEYFDETTNDQVMISYELAELNGISVGDSIKLSIDETTEAIEFVVRGIFTTTQAGSENTIYMNVETAAKLLTEEEYNEGNYNVSNIYYIMDNPENVDKFIEEVNSKYDLEAESLTLDIDSSTYDQMVGPIEQVGIFADTILWIVIIASLLIVTLIINTSIKSRKYEMGVLMSLGATKQNIVGQIFLELLIVATIGFMLSIGTSTLLANGLSETLLQSQTAIEEEVSETNFGRPTNSGKGNMTQGMPGENNNIEEVEVIDEIDVNIEAREYLILFGIGYLVSFIAMVIPTVNIMKYEPKTILTGRE